jgi:hypothetical protein
MPGTDTVGGALRAAAEAVHAPTVTMEWVSCHVEPIDCRVMVCGTDPAAEHERWLRRIADADRKAEAESLVARLTSGDNPCRYCGGDAAAGWTVCYACCHVPEGE